jgi:hypothetical protein
MNQDSDRKREYDFSKAERGKHYAGHDAVVHIPVFLEEEVQSFLLEKAQSKGIPPDQLVNDLLKRDIEAFHALD